MTSAEVFRQNWPFILGNAALWTFVAMALAALVSWLFRWKLSPNVTMIFLSAAWGVFQGMRLTLI